MKKQTQINKDPIDRSVKVEFDQSLCIRRQGEAFYTSEWVTIKDADEADRVAQELVAAAARWRLGK